MESNDVMEMVFASAVTGVAGIIIAYMERERRIANKHWKESDDAHKAIMDRIDGVGSSLGRSIDRVEATSLRTEQKLDQHINDHLTGKLAG